jgi:tyrosyl-tRNA synthetase
MQKYFLNLSINWILGKNCIVGAFFLELYQTHVSFIMMITKLKLSPRSLPSLRCSLPIFRWSRGSHGSGSIEEVNANNMHDIDRSFSSSFLKAMNERGYIHQCTDFNALDMKLSSSTPVPAYLGFDATASSLHVGSLLQIMILRLYQKHGHKPYILIGGGTTKIGDPTGKDESRQLLSNEKIESNTKSISKIFAKFISFGNESTDAMIVNNKAWLDSINYLEFLRNYGKHFTINRMLSYESVKQRLNREQPFTFLEFNYLLLQSYDFLYLYRNNNIQLQIGGSDQWGNIVSGIELGRKVDQASLYGLTAPLISTSNGKKMGKSEQGAIWLDKDQVSEYDYWQFWRNTSDDDTIKFLKLFTEIPIEQINEMSYWEGSQLNDAKIILADEATKLLHGDECLIDIHNTVKSLFVCNSNSNGNGNGNQNLDSLPLVILSLENSEKIKSDHGLNVVEFFLHSNLVNSKAEARRLISGGGARLNDVKVTDEDAVVSITDFIHESRIKVSSGKKKHVVVSLV